MKIFKYALLAIPFLYFSCSDDDDAPDLPNEEEVISTMIVTLTADDGSVVTMLTQDLDGEGTNPPEITGANLSANMNYSGSIVWLNELEEETEDITPEIVDEEPDEHQVFFSSGGDLDLSFEYLNFDPNGDELGSEFSFNAGPAGEGSITIILVHVPVKPNDGDFDLGYDPAISSIDIETQFPITVE